ncbi:MAG: nicotinate-nucleotide--dimethylbenzimidazole phosphoribosyltransferase [Geodermatophilaceae bacterium]
MPAPDAAARAALVDREVDSGCDLLLLAAPGSDAVGATVAIAAFTGEEPVRALGFDPNLADDEWVRRAVAVRDCLRRIDMVGDQEAALGSVGDPALATATGIMAQAARRRTPIVLDGLTALAAAVLVAHVGDLDPKCCLIAAADGRPAAAMAARVLGLSPVLEMGRPTGDGVAALLTLPLLRAAQLLARSS